jgi:lipopolysaccharide biosynthesis glycosyltransferase
MLAVTISVGETPFIREQVDRAAERFQAINGFKLNVLREGSIHHAVPGLLDRVAAPQFLKAYLWDLVPAGVDRLLYLDRDMVAVRPFGELPDVEFGAVLDHYKGLADAQKVWPIFERTGIYFNSGLMLMRRSISPSFDLVKTMQSVERDAHHCFDQTLFNLVIQHTGNVTILPKSWNYCPSIDEKRIKEPVMVHCCGTMVPYNFMAFVMDNLK